MPDPDQIAELQARADAGDRNAAGRLGELLAGRGDPEGAVRVWAQAYGDASPTTRWLAELLAEHEVPGSGGRSGTWGPRPFEQAKAMLISELRRNLSTWAAQGGSDPVRYSQALDTLEAARGPVTIDLPRHILAIAEAPRHGQ
jgi:hypothetical protein